MSDLNILPVELDYKVVGENKINFQVLQEEAKNVRKDVKSELEILEAAFSNGYHDLGNMRIVWGTSSGLTTSNGPTGSVFYSSDDIITFVVAFKNGTIPSVSLGLTGAAAGAWANSRSVTNIGMTLRLLGWDNAQTSTITFIAIGEKP